MILVIVKYIILTRILLALSLPIVLLPFGCAAPTTQTQATITTPSATITPSAPPTASPASTPNASEATAVPSPISPGTPSPTLTPVNLTPSVSLHTKSQTSKVEIRRIGDAFAFIVDDQPVIIKGMNYNVNYTALTDETKRRLHRRDFQILHDAGVNAIVGWGVYDEATLQIAQEFGIGVIMPFDIDPKIAFDNQHNRDQIKSDFRQYIERFRNSPAVWAWNPGGDELLYRMKTDEQRTIDKLQAAADLELELATLANTIDPNHVSVIKEPRDWYIRYTEESLRKFRSQPNSLDPSRYLIFGVNVYGQVDDVATNLSITKSSIGERLGLAMLVGEFAPFLAPWSDRPANYADMWDVVYRFSNIGGFAYAFGPDQPNPNVRNPYDPLTLLPSEFSLVDMNGKPIDDSLSALAGRWRQLGAPTPLPTATLTPSK